jgi:hypothetical protein
MQCGEVWCGAIRRGVIRCVRDSSHGRGSMQCVRCSALEERCVARVYWVWWWMELFSFVVLVSTILLLFTPPPSVANHVQSALTKLTRTQPSLFTPDGTGTSSTAETTTHPHTNTHRCRHTHTHTQRCRHTSPLLSPPPPPPPPHRHIH